MKNKDWLKHLQQGKGKEIARQFFSGFTTQEKVSKILYPDRKKRASGESKRKPKEKMKKTHYVEPIINIRCREWKKLGFLEKSSPIPFKDKLGRPQTTFWQIMNLEPFYIYCSEKHSIEFSSDEKKFVNSLLNDNYKIREIILKLYPDDDIINAILKFYIKHFPLPFDALHGRSKEKFDKEYIGLIDRAERDAKKVIKKFKDNPKEQVKLAKEYHEELLRIEKNPIKYLIKVILYSVSYLYMTNHIKNPQLVLNVDTKFMKVLGIA